MYKLLRTETADAGIRNIVLYIAEEFGTETALQKLSELETAIKRLAENPYIGIDPRYMVLRRQGFKVLITEKDLVFYKILEKARDDIQDVLFDLRQTDTPEGGNEDEMEEISIIKKEIQSLMKNSLS